jgi:hypothetical protein
MGQHAQVGLVAAASCEEYLKNIIKKHELTRVDKEDDRVRHIEALNSQTGPVFLTYRAVKAFDAFVAKKISERPPWISPPKTACATRRGPFPTRTKSSSSKRSSRRFRFFTSPTAIIAARRRRAFSSRARARATADNSSP